MQSDHVVGIVGNFSLIECSVDSSYWQSLGFSIIDSGIASACYSTPNSAAVNMGPRYSSDGAVQYALAQHPGKVVFVEPNLPGDTYVAAGPNALAAAAKVPITDMTANVPTPCNTDFLAEALGSTWNDKLFVNAELTPSDTTNTATMNLYKAIYARYGSAVSGGIGSFSQMGFTEAELTVKALESVKGAYTVASVNAAIKALKDVNTGMLCQQWTYGSYSTHIPNNEDYTVTPDNGKMVLAPNGGCTQISAVDPQIAQYRVQAGTAPADPTSS